MKMWRNTKEEGWEMISNVHRNIMGTVSFDGKFEGMRKAQDFIVYPMKSAEEYVKIQSDTRIGVINLDSGNVRLSPPRKGGSSTVHLGLAVFSGKLPPEELLVLKAEIHASASKQAGSTGVCFVDNSGASKVFG